MTDKSGAVGTPRPFTSLIQGMEKEPEKAKGPSEHVRKLAADDTRFSEKAGLQLYGAAEYLQKGAMKFASSGDGTVDATKFHAYLAQGPTASTLQKTERAICTAPDRHGGKNQMSSQNGARAYELMQKLNPNVPDFPEGNLPAVSEDGYGSDGSAGGASALPAAASGRMPGGGPVNTLPPPIKK